MRDHYILPEIVSPETKHLKWVYSPKQLLAYKRQASDDKV